MPFPNLNGRPPEYTDEEACNKLVEYYQKCEDEKKLPTAAGLSLYMGVSKDTVRVYSVNEDKKHEQFSLSYAILMSAQEDGLVQGGLSGEYNSNIAKLLLHNHGYSDKSQVQNETTSINYDIESDDPEEKLQDVLQRIKRLREQE